MELCASTVWTSLMRVSPVSRSIAPCRFSRSRPDVTSIAQRWPRGSHRPAGLGLVGRMDGIHVDDRLVRIERVAQILVRVDEPLLDRSVDLARRGLRLLPVEADAVHQLDQPGFAIFDAEPAADELPDLDGRRRQNLHRPGAKLVDLEGRQRAGSALEIEQDEFFDSAFVVGLEPDADGRIVNEKDLRHSSNFMPRSSRISAFARRAMRCSSSPSLAISTRMARSAGLRKLRFAIIR